MVRIAVCDDVKEMLGILPAEHALQRIFRTESGKSICRVMFGLTEGTADQAGTISIQ